MVEPPRSVPDPSLIGINTASPFVPPPPSVSPGAVSLPPSDSEWSTASDWSLNASNPSSRAPSPYHLAAHLNPQFPPTVTEEHIRTLINVCNAIGGRATPIPSTSQCYPSAPLETSASRPATPEAKRKKVRRPANAFMLYRSWLIKSGRIPKEVEKRQQNISRVAGDCWRLLTAKEKEEWHDKAEVVKKEHIKLYPEYKFTPERKSSRRKAAADPDVQVPEGEDLIRFIREKYVGIQGESKAPSRPRKSSSRRKAKVKAEAEPVPTLSHASTPSPASISVPRTPVSLSGPSSAPAMLADYQMPVLPDIQSLPHEINQDMLGKFVASIAEQNAMDDDMVCSLLRCSSLHL